MKWPSHCMSAIVYIKLSLLINGSDSLPSKHGRRFHDEFLFGAATAAYQIEGAWDSDDKSENIWDHLIHTNPNMIADRSNGDIAADSYHNYKIDVQMMRELGLDMYRFSISWSRILPEGFSNKISQRGVAFYNNYIDEMLKYNITPIATLYHWDLPQRLQNMGGFLNPLFSDWFEDYARVVFASFGDRVKYWITMNEPSEICFQGYGATYKAPALNMSGIGDYLCAKNLVMAHAKAYRAYEKDFKPLQGGICGITISINWLAPDTDSEDDEMAAVLKRQADWGMYADPIFSAQGGFPKELSERVAIKSAEQGYSRSRMPEFTEEERRMALGSSDFLGVNHYTAFLISATKYKENNLVPSLYDDAGVGSHSPDEWLPSASNWLKLAPDSLYNVLKNLKEKYNNPAIFITENGWSTTTGLEDDGRIKYYRAALENVLDALDEGINVKAYMAWSLMDNFEWMFGYTERFGLYEVDFENPKRTRTPRKSAFVYKNIIQTRSIDYTYNPVNRTMSVDDKDYF